MLKCLQPNPQESAAGHLLILGCSDKKIESYSQAPALEIYDGPNYRVLRKFLRENGWAPGLMIKIISAENEIIDATTLIRFSDLCLNKETEKGINLKELGEPKSIFIDAGENYQSTISDIMKLFSSDKVIWADNKGGQKTEELRRWLSRLPNRTASVPFQQSDRRSYLYFFPDWDDYVYEPFQKEETDGDRSPENRKYAHEIFKSDPPYDGLLFSLAQMLTERGPLNRLSKKDLFDLRGDRRIPEDMLLFGDPGAFSYTADSEPPITSEKAASLYDKFDFDLGASVDHIPIPSITPEERKKRMDLTEENAEQFLKICEKNEYQFVPVGSIQGFTVDDYVYYVQRYVEMGYKHIALGGLVRRKDSRILEIIAAVREALQKYTCGKEENIWVHLFGVLRPDLQDSFQHLGVSSFDSASYLRKAWLSSDRNYLAPDGEGDWYGTIRVPISASKAMRDVAESNSMSIEKLEELENQCLSSLGRFDGTPESKEEVLANIDEYGPLLQRKGEDNHFVDKHEALMTDQPWEKCECAVCKELGIQVVVFRGSNRNRRRGFHNTWVFYHKILHGKRGNSLKKSDS